eukprot:CAMPEP_0176363014 /NCGR_PEP_ID=MMETSP0126-20121128/18819_1 /TAXON_ID=141414 ORGANISM="Strombidinopsis acuminatum, Strain SPMC142" /NCGR_SAMPLE_ID=MMETSP0126 /ASSEMBLY_ACC=CAM_ASM_000229 /LENGTH=134 /DNA_ID=CAMNT_0017719137 /DNA_START=1548 /DNA_END=1952 /DNA_ORIENTATION=+
MVFLIEFVNLVNICANTTIINIVMNYVALAVVAEFDDYIYSAIKRGDKMATLMEKDLLQIEVTTTSQLIIEEKCLSPFSKRTIGNKIARCIYLIWRLLYVMIYFYFFEFITLVLISIFPIIYRDVGKTAYEANP